jgi:hypothetical protein
MISTLFARLGARVGCYHLFLKKAAFSGAILGKI